MECAFLSKLCLGSWLQRCASWVAQFCFCNRNTFEDQHLSAVALSGLLGKGCSCLLQLVLGHLSRSSPEVLPALTPWLLMKPLEHKYRLGDGRSWTRWPLKVPCRPTHSMIHITLLTHWKHHSPLLPMLSTLADIYAFVQGCLVMINAFLNITSQAGIYTNQEGAEGR